MQVNQEYKHKSKEPCKTLHKKKKWAVGLYFPKSLSEVNIYHHSLGEVVYEGSLRH